MSDEPNRAHSDEYDDPLTDHEYDGILEYDNPMPTWWRRTFWLTFAFSVVYFVHFQLTGNGSSVSESYASDMREFREFLAAQALGEEMTEEGLTELMQNAQLMQDAQTVFSTRCVQCHAARGQGNIGPNLTDDYWLYGSGSLMDIYDVVANGRTDKGMPAWSRQLRPMELGQVVALVGTMRNTHVAGKPPQGTKVAPAATPPTSAPEPGSEPEPPSPPTLGAIVPEGRGAPAPELEAPNQPASLQSSP